MSSDKIPINFKVSSYLLLHLNTGAKLLGMNRSEYIRYLIVRDLTKREII